MFSPLEPGELGRANEMSLCLFGKGKEIDQVALRHQRHLPRFYQLVIGILANRLQEAITCRPVLFVHVDQRLIDQSGQDVEQSGWRHTLCRADSLCCFQGATVGKYGEVLQHCTLCRS